MFYKLLNRSRSMGDFLNWALQPSIGSSKAQQLSFLEFDIPWVIWEQHRFLSRKKWTSINLLYSIVRRELLIIIKETLFLL